MPTAATTGVDSSSGEAFGGAEGIEGPGCPTSITGNSFPSAVFGGPCGTGCCAIVFVCGTLGVSVLAAAGAGELVDRVSVGVAGIAATSSGDGNFTSDGGRPGASDEGVAGAAAIELVGIGSGRPAVVAAGGAAAGGIA